MMLLRVFASVLTFVGILAGCLTLVLLAILLVRFPPLLIAVLLACWIFSRLSRTSAKPPRPNININEPRRSHSRSHD